MSRVLLLTKAFRNYFKAKLFFIDALRFIDKDRQGVGLGEFVGGVDNKAGHYSVSPGRQGWADGQRGGGYTCSGAEGAPTPAPESIRANECPAAGSHQVSSQWPVGARDGQTSGLGLDHPGVPLPEGWSASLAPVFSSHSVIQAWMAGQRGNIWA